MFDAMKGIKMTMNRKRKTEKGNWYHAQEWKQNMDLFALLRIMLIKCSHLSFSKYSPFVFLFQFGVLACLSIFCDRFLCASLFCVWILRTFWSFCAFVTPTPSLIFRFPSLGSYSITFHQCAYRYRLLVFKHLVFGAQVNGKPNNNHFITEKEIESKYGNNTCEYTHLMMLREWERIKCGEDGFQLTNK